MAKKPRSSTLVSVAILAIAAACEGGVPTADTPSSRQSVLLELIDPADVGPEQRATASQYLRDGVKAIHHVNLVGDVGGALAELPRVQIELSPETTIQIHRRNYLDHGNGVQSYGGPYTTVGDDRPGASAPRGLAGFVKTPGGISGFVRADADTPLANYTIEPIGDGLHVIFQYDHNSPEVREFLRSNAHEDGTRAAERSE